MSSRNTMLDKIVFRVDSSLVLGSGHVIRCLALADELVRGGAEVSFISRDLPGNINQIIEQRGYSLYRLPVEEDYSTLFDRNDYNGHLRISLLEEVEQTIVALKSIRRGKTIPLLVVDHYYLDERWEKLIRPFVNRIMVIDDLANRRHDCDVLVDHNQFDDMNVRYNGLVPVYCKLLLGNEYAIIRRSFLETRKKLHSRTGNIESILIFFGGSDPTNKTK